MWDGIDRRRFPRANFPCKITLYSKEKPQIFSCFTENIGAGGVCVILKESLELFSLVGIELILKQNYSINCTGRVVWVIGRKDWKTPRPTAFDTGIEFVDLKPQDKKKIQEVVEEIISQNK